MTEKQWTMLLERLLKRMERLERRLAVLERLAILEATTVDDWEPKGL
jgi:hypothetical protein